MKTIGYASICSTLLLSACSTAPHGTGVGVPNGQVSVDDAIAARRAELQQLQALAPSSPRSLAMRDYAARVRARVHPFVVFKNPEVIPGNPSAVVYVLLGPDGMVVSARLMQSSGVPAWDSAVLSAIQQASPLPVLPDPQDRRFTITFRPKN